MLLRLLLCLAPLLAQDRVQPLTILHTNDLHAHLLPSDIGAGGFAQLATLVRQERLNCAACLYLNAGDLVQGTPVSTLFRGRPVYEIANLLGIDASTLGNHEFDYGWRRAAQFSKVARFPVLSANVVDQQGRTLTGKPYTVLTAGGIRVAVIGVLMGNLVGTLVTQKAIGPCRVLPVIDTVRRYVEEVKPRSDLIVVLGHLLSDEVDAILHDVPEVSVVVVGHDHRGYSEMRRVDGRVAVLEKGYGVELGRLDLQVNLTAHRLQSAQWKRIPIDATQIQPDPQVARSVARWEARVSKIVDVKIGESKRRLSGQDLATVIERALIDETGVDLAYENRGGVRDVLPAGTILARNIWNILPFDNLAVIGKFKGSRLPAEVTSGRSIDPDREYTLATSDFVADIWAANAKPGTALVFPKVGKQTRDIMIDWIRKKRIVD